MLTPRPVRAEVRRDNFLDRLTYTTASITLLEAPSGYGKTTLAAQYARCQTERPAVWASLTSNAADARAFGDQLARALERAGFQPPAWSVAADFDAGPDAFAQALLSDLNDVPVDLLLVVDHAEHLSAESARVLHGVLEHLGTWHRVIVNTHQGGHVNLARLIASGLAERYTEEDLRFSPNETATFVDHLGQGGQSGLDAHALHQRTDGWPVAISLMTVPGAHGREVVEVVDSILARMSVDLQEAVIHASVLPAWREGTLVDLGLPPLRNWQQAAARAGIPLIRRGDAVYPHDLVRDALEQLLRRDPEMHSQMHVRAATLAQQAGEFYAAVLHALQAGAYDQAQGIVLRELLPRWQRHSDWTLAAQTLAQFPPSALGPDLCAYLGLAYGEIGQQDQAHAIFHAQTEAGTETEITYFGLLLMAHRQGEPKQALDWAERGLARASSAYGRVQLLRSQAAILHVLGRYSEALPLARQAVREAEEHDNVALLLSAQTVLCWVYEVMGDSTRALALSEQIFRTAVGLGFVNKALLIIPKLIDLLIDHDRLSEAEQYASFFRENYERYPWAVNLQWFGQFSRCTGTTHRK